MSQVGIEPTTRGLKVPCSTTELLAQALPDSTSKTQQYAQPPPNPIVCRASNWRKMAIERTNGEGSVFKRKDGRVVGVYEDTNGMARSITSKTMSKAEMKASARSYRSVTKA